MILNDGLQLFEHVKLLADVSQALSFSTWIAP